MTPVPRGMSCDRSACAYNLLIFAFITTFNQMPVSQPQPGLGPQGGVRLRLGLGLVEGSRPPSQRTSPEWNES